MKRILAGTFDFTFIFLIVAISHYFSKHYFGTNANPASSIVSMGGIVVYLLLRYHQTTAGGLVTGLKVSSQSEKPMFFLRAFLLAFIPYAWFFIIQGSSLILVINILPAFFTEKRLMLHDIISRSFVEVDDRQTDVLKKQKKTCWIIFIILVVVQCILSILIAQDILPQV